jgi:hypothetical protein
MDIFYNAKEGASRALRAMREKSQKQEVTSILDIQASVQHQLNGKS